MRKSSWSFIIILSLSLSLSLSLLSLSILVIGMIISLSFDPSPTMSNLYHFPLRSLKDLLSSEKKYCTTGTTLRHDLLLLLLCTNNATCYVKSRQHWNECIMLKVRVCNDRLRYVVKCKSANNFFFIAKHVNANFPILTRSSISWNKKLREMK